METKERNCHFYTKKTELYSLHYTVPNCPRKILKHLLSTHSSLSTSKEKEIGSFDLLSKKSQKDTAINEENRKNIRFDLCHLL